MPEHLGLWKYCDKEQCKDMLLSFRLVGSDSWTDGKIMACLYALSNHAKEHYHKTELPKKRGGRRILMVPDPLLKQVQRNLLHHVLEGFSVSPAACAYRKGASPLANASLHTGKRLVLKLDIHDFFGSITFPMVLHHVFPSTYFPPAVGTLLASLCCYRDRLPQGAPTSPAVSNLVMKPFDDHMLEWCRSRRITYSRYSDDMAFSGDFDPGEVIRKTENFLRAMGMELNREKTRVCAVGGRQSVTGIVVNEKPGLPRDYRRALRQELHYCMIYGVEEKSAACLRSLLGKTVYLLSVNPEDQWFQGAEAFLREELKKIEEKGEEK